MAQTRLADTMEVYQEAMKAIERERINFLNKIDLVQPSFDEQHQLEWGSRYQEEELLSLRSGLAEVSREVEAETEQLRDREEIIQAIREEQQQDRVKIQTLLALSQPITPDITVVFQALAPDKWSTPQRQAVAVSAEQRRRRRSRRGDGGGRGTDEEGGTAVRGGRRAHRRPNRVRVAVGGANDDSDNKDDYAGTTGGGTGHYSSGEEDTKGEDSDKEDDDGSSDGHPPREGSSARGSSYGLRPGRRWDSEVARGHAGRAGVHQRDAVTRRRRRRRSRGAEGRRGGAGGRPATKREKEASRLRCTRGYQEHLERRLELTQKHLRELAQLDGSFRETLDRDRQEREIQVKVQRENDTLVVDSLKRRTAEVDKRVAAATEDYLRLRHKAKEAHAASAADQRRCAEAREQSQAEVRALLAAAERDLEAIKQEGRRRLDDCTVGLREDLGTSEERLQSERAHQADIKRRFEERIGRAREGVLLTRRRYHKLVRRRAQEVVHLSEEMSALRRGVTELERRMFQAW
ncbi:unnamed protein product [Scytosiphon promiscuus]